MLKTASRVNATRRPTNITRSVPAPVGGWNSRDSLAAMKPHDAVLLQNFWCTPTSVFVRKGYVQWSTGYASPVETLMPYNSPTTSQLFAASGTSFFNATAGGAVGAAVVAGLTNARWRYANYAISATRYLYCVNGTDSPRLYDGATWTTITGVSVPAITGVTTSLLTDVMEHKTRLWFIEANSMRAWYLPVNAVGGLAVVFDFGGIFQGGGKLVAQATWTLDAGTGSDDLAVWITSEGEVAVYKGTDPSSANTWALVGVYSIGRPIGNRPFYKYGGDLLVICEDGLFPLSKALQTAIINIQQAVSDKINKAISDFTSLYGNNFGWQVKVWPMENMLLLNVPTSSTTSQQCAMNTISQSWSLFTGWNARCFESSGGGFFFGDSTSVNKIWTVGTDNSAQVVADACTAFSAFGNPAVRKAFDFCRIVLRTDGTPSILAQVNTDFDTTAPTGSVSVPGGSIGMVWGSMTWGSMTWGGLSRTIQQWSGAQGLGYYGAIRVRVAAKTETVEWMSSDYSMRVGGML